MQKAQVKQKKSPQLTSIRNKKREQKQKHDKTQEKEKRII